MGDQKKIQIKAEYLIKNDKKGGRRKKKKKPKDTFIKPTKVRQAFINRIKNYQKVKDPLEGGKKKDNQFKTDFKSSLNYLNSIVERKQTKKRHRKEKKRKRFEAKKK